MIKALKIFSVGTYKICVTNIAVKYKDDSDRVSYRGHGEYITINSSRRAF